MACAAVSLRPFRRAIDRGRCALIVRLGPSSRRDLERRTRRSLTTGNAYCERDSNRDRAAAAALPAPSSTLRRSYDADSSFMTVQPRVAEEWPCVGGG